MLISITGPFLPNLAYMNNQGVWTEKYDTLINVKERAAERYKVNFKKWRAFNDWLFAEDIKYMKYRNEPGITHEEKEQRYG